MWNIDIKNSTTSQLKNTACTVTAVRVTTVSDNRLQWQLTSSKSSYFQTEIMRWNFYNNFLPTIVFQFPLFSNLYYFLCSLFHSRNLGLQSSKMLNPEAYLLGTTLPLCQQISGLSNGQQKLCMLYTDHMMHVGRGARRGIVECKFQFNERKWNCSTVEDSTVFGPILSIRKCPIAKLLTWSDICLS